MLARGTQATVTTHQDRTFITASSFRAQASQASTVTTGNLVMSPRPIQQTLALCVLMPKEVAVHDSADVTSDAFSAHPLILLSYLTTTRSVSERT